MGKLCYSMLTSLDGRVSDRDGDFEWATPDDELHAFINDELRQIGTSLYGRRMYEMMVYWETAHLLPEQSAVARDFTQIWQATDKIVYSTTLDEPASARTRIERTFDPEAVRRLKAESEQDLTIDGPQLAAQAIRAGLVDEIQLYVNPIVVGGGNAFFPDVRLDLELLRERRFASGVVALRYRVRDNT